MPDHHPTIRVGFQATAGRVLVDDLEDNRDILAASTPAAGLKGAGSTGADVERPKPDRPLAPRRSTLWP
jgi:hypothetical protein